MVIVEDIKPDQMEKKFRRHLKRQAQERRLKFRMGRDRVTHLQRDGNESVDEKKQKKIWFSGFLSQAIKKIWYLDFNSPLDFLWLV